ncbi:MAG: DNA polymerase III subunit gamma/tau [Bacteroidetes bacterium]|nr:DNA polymerase III subunit gamma/tau [Bacteroidota bacterium]
MEKYVVSARKYRPLTFDTVVGQEHVTRTLLNEIRNNHLAQAFLFNGPRGVGKTTCARILAREINKESVEDPNYDYSYNIFELDAASNNSVDDIRLLNEQVRIPPQVGSYKVYIIDEVHMLSSSAFNAFLKTLEEPPPYAVFILATTERHKILPTILSRCQVFNFNRISVGDMVNHLKGIAEKEGIGFEEEGLHIIAQKADGALRDALSIFDQMASIGDGTIRYQDVIENLSVLDYDHYFEITEAFREQDLARVLVKFDTLLDKGFDAQIFLNGLSSHFRDLMVVRDERSLNLLDVAPRIKAKYQEYARNLSMGFLVNAINVANSYDLSYKASRNQRLHVELALMKICYLPSLVNPAEKKKPGNDVVPTAEIKSKPAGNESPVSEKISQPDPKTEPATPANKSKPVKPAAVEDGKVARLGNLDSLLSGISSTVTEPAQKIEVKTEERADSTPESLVDKVFNNEDVAAALLKYSEQLAENNQTRLQSIFKFIQHETDGKTITIKLSKQHRIQFEEIRTDMLIFLRDELQNQSVLLNWIEVKTEAGERRAYTSQEKFDAMAAKNPNLKKLRDDLQLNIE